jgi:hypothetical protein
MAQKSPARSCCCHAAVIPASPSCCARPCPRPTRVGYVLHCEEERLFEMEYTAYSSKPTCTAMPSQLPSVSANPSLEVLDKPSISGVPSGQPSMSPTLSGAPSSGPSIRPSLLLAPSGHPSTHPSTSVAPSSQPSMAPSLLISPSSQPSGHPLVCSAI